MDDTIKKEHPLVSVVVPVYNTSRYLDECLSSLVNQTLKDIEIICINDASTDDSLEKLQKWALKDSRIVVIDSPDNVKAGGARNLGIRAARAEYIGFVDSDDYVCTGMYKELIDNSNNMTAEIVNSNLHVLHGATDQFHWNIPSGGQLSKDQLKRSMVKYGMRMWTGIFKKNLFDKYDLYYPEKLFYEDNAIGIPIFYVAESIVFIDNIIPTYYYRTNNIVSITKSTSHDKLHDRRETSKMMLSHTKRLNLYDNYKEEIDFYFYKLFYRNTVAAYMSRIASPNINYIRQLYGEYTTLCNSLIRDNKYFNECHSKLDLLCNMAGKNTFICYALILMFKTNNLIKSIRK